MKDDKEDRSKFSFVNKYAKQSGGQNSLSKILAKKDKENEEQAKKSIEDVPIPKAEKDPTVLLKRNLAERLYFMEGQAERKPAVYDPISKIQISPPAYDKAWYFILIFKEQHVLFQAVINRISKLQEIRKKQVEIWEQEVKLNPSLPPIPPVPSMDLAKYGEVKKSAWGTPPSEAEREKIKKEIIDEVMSQKPFSQ